MKLSLSLYGKSIKGFESCLEDGSRLRFAHYNDGIVCIPLGTDMNSSGRGLQFIEDFVVSEVMPAVTDAASMATLTGLQTNMFLDQAKFVHYYSHTKCFQTWLNR